MQYNSPLFWGFLIRCACVCVQKRLKRFEIFYRSILQYVSTFDFYFSLPRTLSSFVLLSGQPDRASSTKSECRRSRSKSMEKLPGRTEGSIQQLARGGREALHLMGYPSNNTYRSSPSKGKEKVSHGIFFRLLPLHLCVCIGNGFL